MPPPRAGATSKLKWNVLANLVGRAGAAALALLTLPWVIHLIGIESYGILGFFASLQAIFGLLDLGLSATLMRELARRGHEPEQAQATRDLVRTLEVCYWGIGVLIALIAIGIAPFVGTHWLQLTTVTPTTARQAVMLMGLAAACQWPISLYEGGITGLQRQVAVNVLNIAMGVLRTGASLAVLIWVSPTVEAYLIVQGLVYLVQMLAFRHLLWRSLLPWPGRPRFRRASLQGIWRFASGISVTSGLGVALSQADKVVLSKVLPLKVFGYYMIAQAVASGLNYIIGPIYTALFPQFSQAAATGAPGFRDLYHRGCQLMSVAIFPTALILMMFSGDVLLLWTTDATIATGAATTVAIVTFGQMLHAMYYLPYAAQLAHGWTSLSMKTNAAMVVVLVPVTSLLAVRFGVVGGALGWVLLNVVYVCVVIPAMHRRILVGELRSWAATDVGRPALAAVLVVLAWRLVLPDALPPLVTLAGLGAAWVTASVASAYAAPVIRSWGLEQANLRLRQFGLTSR